MINESRVSEIYNNCLSNSGIKAEGVFSTVFFNKEKIDEHRKEITEMLKQFPDELIDGLHFLNLSYDKEGHWTEHLVKVEQLVLLGIAIKKLSLIGNIQNLVTPKYPIVEYVQINSLRVIEIVEECLHDDLSMNNDNVKPVIVEGIINDFYFNKSKLDKHKDEIYDMLLELPDGFKKSSGGGWSFNNMLDTKSGIQWSGIHAVMEMLLVLGIGINKVEYCAERKYWEYLPLGMPYLVINDESEKDK